VGSSNLDPLSLLLAREANVVVDDAGFASDLRHRLVQAMEQQGLQVDPAHYAKRPFQQRLSDRLAYGLMRLAVFLTGNRY
jgi:cardiolipin synthase